jgi:signal transduction histidine kinase
MMGMIERASSLWDVPVASPAPPRRVWRDWALIVILPPLILLEGFLRPELPYLELAIVITIATVATLMWRRTHPLAMFAIGFGASELFAIVTGGGVQLYSSAYLLLLVYAVFRWGSGRALLIGATLMVAAAIAGTLRGPFDLANLVGGLLFLLVTASLGLLLRFRSESRVREIDRAKSREREELARDLHDTVAHHVSAIAIQAQACA